MNHEPHELHEPMLYAQEVFAIQGAIFEVNRHMGTGFASAPKVRIERLIL